MFVYIYVSAYMHLKGQLYAVLSSNQVKESGQLFGVIGINLNEG